MSRLMNRLSIGLVVASMVLFPIGTLVGNRVVAAVGAACIGCGALIGAILDQRNRRHVRAV